MYRDACHGDKIARPYLVYDIITSTADPKVRSILDHAETQLVFKLAPIIHTIVVRPDPTLPSTFLSPSSSNPARRCHSSPRPARFCPPPLHVSCQLASRRCQQVPCRATTLSCARSLTCSRHQPRRTRAQTLTHPKTLRRWQRKSRREAHGR